MFKILLIILVPVFVAGGLIYLLTIRSAAPAQPTVPGAKEVPLTASSDSTPLSSSQPLPTAKSDLLPDRVKTLETSVSILNKKIDILTASLSKLTSPVPSATPIVTTQSSSSTSSPKSIYIPVGLGGSSVATSDFESINTQQITIDSADYPGYKQAVLEVNFKIYQGNGTGEARLFNSTDGTALLGSIVSTTSENYSTVTSGGFNLSSGNKSYTLQLKSTTGYSVDVQLARIRIDY